MFLLDRFLAAHFVGRRLIYPGSLGVFNMVVGEEESVCVCVSKHSDDSVCCDVCFRYPSLSGQS